MRLVATKTLRYATRRLLPGDQFETRKDNDARVLIATRRARHINERERAELAPPPESVLAKATPRRLAASAAPDQPDTDMAAVRAEYFEKMGKRPFHGWDVATLREKMAEDDA